MGLEIERHSDNKKQYVKQCNSASVNNPVSREGEIETHTHPNNPVAINPVLSKEQERALKHTHQTLSEL